jgi:Tol biopolymer transport system component/DNA-binding winged helix-turn-helix (wHTH) protein
MHRQEAAPKLFRFGPFELNSHTGELRRNGVRVRLPDQSCTVLTALLQRPGNLVSREELHQLLWKDGVLVDFDHGLNVAVRRLRQALGDAADEPRYIETLPRKGYRFLASAEAFSEPAPAVPAPGVPDSAIAADPDPRRGGLFRSRTFWAITIALTVSAVIPLAALFFRYSLSGQSGSAAPNWNIRPVTRFPGLESKASWSPDGRFVTFSWFHPGDENIFVMPLSGGTPVQLTHSPADDCDSRWSPDGRYIAFLGDTGRTKLVYLITPSGGEPRLLADTQIPFMERFVESWKALGSQPWSPDGQEIVFSRLDSDGRISPWSINVETRQQSRLTSPPPGSDDFQAAWSSDGRWLAFSRTEAGLGSLWIMPAHGGPPRVLFRDGSDNIAPAWSLDNRRLVFQSNRLGAQNLWDIEIASGRLRKITNGAGIEALPAVGPKGLLYQQHQQRVEIWSLDTTTGSEAQLTHNTGRNYWPRISSDGRWLVYDSDRTHAWDVWLTDLQTGSEKPLTHDAAVNVTPEWAPDGRSVSFISNRDGKFRIWVMDIEHGSPRRFLEQPVHAPSAISFGSGQMERVHGWSPDGRKIGFIADTSTGPALWVADAQGRNARQIAAGVMGFDWYRDAGHILYTRTSPDGSWTRELVARDLGTGTEQVLYRGPHMDIAAARDGKAVLFCYSASHSDQSLFMLPLAQRAGESLPHAGEPRQLTGGKGLWHAHHGSWSPDGKTVFYARDYLQGDIYLIENYR